MVKLLNVMCIIFTLSGAIASLVWWDERIFGTVILGIGLLFCIGTMLKQSSISAYEYQCNDCSHVKGLVDHNDHSDTIIGYGCSKFAGMVLEDGFPFCKAPKGCFKSSTGLY